jgi:nucleoside transporter
MNTSVRNKLSVMMFLEIFIWGAWFIKIFDYMAMNKFGYWETVGILNAFAIASFTAMFFSAQFADRHFAAEKFLAFSHLVGGAALIALGWVNGFWPFFLVFLLYTLFYVPTISVANSIAFTHLKDAQHDFGRVRLWGTVGWIAASWPFIFILTDWANVPAFGSVSLGEWLGKALGTPLKGDALREGTRYTFVTAGIASLLLAAFSLTLPHTPPKPAGEARESLAWLEAMKLLRWPFVLVLWVVTFLDASIHQCYFVLTDQFLQTAAVGIPANWTMPVMSIGQFAEIVTMAVLGLVLKRLGWKTTMIVGVLGHVLRFAVFALAPLPWLVVLVNVVHGICYAFFFATVYIFVDEFFPKDARSSAQGLFNFMILGLGVAAGNFLAPYLKDVFTTDKVTDYRRVFLVPAGMGLVAALILALFFYPPKSAASSPVGHAGGYAPSPDLQEMGPATGIKKEDQVTGFQE